MELKIKIWFNNGVNEDSDPVLKGIRKVCKKAKLMEINGSGGPLGYSCLFTDNERR